MITFFWSLIALPFFALGVIFECAASGFRGGQALVNYWLEDT